ncbi:MAG: hypothetical protein JRF72_12870 [Deltaproteobacteria bacterium]|jgi:hypothetical protein|nr:hypothetical protein [Deltaproteobacteria bacterium]
MMSHKPIRLGDIVRIRSTPETRSLGLAGKMGQVYGHTMPFVTCIKYIGETQQDLAFNVFFEEFKQGFWFAPELLELADHAPEADVQEGFREWGRIKSGEWKKIKKTSAPKPVSPYPIEPVGLLGRLLKMLRGNLNHQIN